ncbi:hypothetical protein SUGI_1046970 [Cryptomeria japonica]|nr:hypothetical protein SUGI_1046970 [Cryptomeria japonica]
MTKMGYNGKGLGINEQDMINLVEAKQRPRNQGLGYGATGESSKAFKKAISVVRTPNYGGGSEVDSSPEKKAEGQEKVLNYCTHCEISGHRIEMCWKLNLELRRSPRFIEGPNQQKVVEAGAKAVPEDTIPKTEMKVAPKATIPEAKEPQPTKEQLAKGSAFDQLRKSWENPSSK